MNSLSNKQVGTKKIILIVGSILLVCAALFSYLFFYHGSIFGWQPFPDSNSNDPTSQQAIDSANNVKQQTIEDSQSDTTDSSSKTDPTDNASSNLVVTIPYADASRLTVLIDKVIDGTCDLTLTNNSTTLTDSADIQAGPNSSTCKGFTYKTLSSGKWTAQIIVKSGSGTTTTASKEILIP